MGRIYGYYCPVAHALGILGERWSLLIVRDLLEAPKRFTDLLTRLGNITPKWLTLRLRQLQAAGLVERIRGRDRREKWYQLTPSGQDLRPTIEALRTWGLRHAMRPPLPGEVVHPELALKTLTASLNSRNKKLARAGTWLFAFSNGRSFTLSFDGRAWAVAEKGAENPDVTVMTSPERWATFLTVRKNERRKIVETIHIWGRPERYKEFMRTFGVPDGTPQISKPS